jgi:hypothetical protein
MTERDLSYLLARIDVLEQRFAALVAHRRSDDPAPDDPFRGLYLTDDGVDRLLAGGTGAAPPADPGRRATVERAADAEEDAGTPLRLRELARSCDLTGLDVELLVVALAPDVDSRFERLYGYLNDDVTRRRATIGLAFEILGALPADARARGRLSAGAPLVGYGLLEIEEAERPFLTRGLRVPDRVTSHLLGDDHVDPALQDTLTETALLDAAPADGIVRALRSGVGFVHIRERARGTAASVAAAAMARCGLTPVHVDLSRVGSGPDVAATMQVAMREALLCRGGVLAGPIEAMADTAPAALRRLTAAPVPVLTYGTASWDPLWSDVVPLLADATLPSAEQRAALWSASLGSELAHLDAATTAHFVLSPVQVSRAVRAARSAATFAGTAPRSEDLRTGARAQNAAGLERLARRIEPQVSWPDLVLLPTVLSQLRDVAARARHRERVLTEWRMRPGGGRGSGITALFAGDSGTGKTMSAEAIAGELGLDLYTVNLATVIDKYVGETEKNLERIFAEATGVNAVLLFDEADAIFGKRSEVRDAHDRYANIESAYLLQRMETFDGLAVLATNLRANIDDAFTRRLDAIVDFPEPTEPLRLELWRRCLAPPLPVGDDVDLEFCARAFTLSGGNIRSIAVTAAYRAAASDAPITMTDVIAAVQQEYRKLGRLVVEQEFGDYLIAAQ